MLARVIQSFADIFYINQFSKCEQKKSTGVLYSGRSP